jgi:hypothetical protein
MFVYFVLLILYEYVNSRRLLFNGGCYLGSDIFLPCPIMYLIFPPILTLFPYLLGNNSIPFFEVKFNLFLHLWLGITRHRFQKSPPSPKKVWYEGQSINRSDKELQIGLDFSECDTRAKGSHSNDPTNQQTRGYSCVLKHLKQVGDISTDMTRATDDADIWLRQCERCKTGTLQGKNERCILNKPRGTSCWNGTWCAIREDCTIIRSRLISCVISPAPLWILQSAIELI